MSDDEFVNVFRHNSNFDTAHISTPAGSPCLSLARLLFFLFLQLSRLVNSFAEVAIRCSDETQRAARQTMLLGCCSWSDVRLQMRPPFPSNRLTAA